MKYDVNVNVSRVITADIYISAKCEDDLHQARVLADINKSIKCMDALINGDGMVYLTKTQMGAVIRLINQTPLVEDADILSKIVNTYG